MKAKRITVFVAIVLVLLIAVFVSQQTPYTASLTQSYSPSPTISRFADDGYVLYVSDLKDLYPDVYESYMAGLSTVKDKDGKPHSHAGLREAAENGEGLYRSFNGGIGCLACKTSDLNRLYLKYGPQVWDMKYEDIESEVIDYWDCYICHQNDPEHTVGAMALTYQVLAEDYLKTLSPGDASCGQCHSIIGGYTRRLVSLPGQSLETLDPYRYGTDADAIIKAFMEDGDTLVVDSENVEFFFAGHPDVEIFQGSNHQSQGLSCPSCHMVTEVNPKTGQQYINHNASGSPLTNDTALTYCRTCHKSQGIADNDGMVSFVKQKQKALQEQSDAVLAKLEELHALIVAGTDDPAIDRQARDLYVTAHWYRGYADGGVEIAGAKAAHAYEAMSAYYSSALAYAKQGIALYRNSPSVSPSPDSRVFTPPTMQR